MGLNTSVCASVVNISQCLGLNDVNVVGGIAGLPTHWEVVN